MSSSAFPKILHIGDKQILDLFEGEVEITEKLDGSQFGFGMVDGELVTRSKGRVIVDPDRLFIPAVDHVRSIEHLLPEDLFFYGETLCQPRHSTLAYDRTPTNNIALFGVFNRKTKEFLDYENIKWWAEKLEVDAVPLLFKGIMSQSEVLKFVDDTLSYLGGQNIEGIVVKAYKPWVFIGQIPLSVMSGKYVTEAFKEVHHKNWKAENTGKGRLEVAISQYRTEARWNKAVQHLEESGRITGTPKDIGELVKSVRADVEEEEKENIKETLWSIFGEQFLKSATNGLPQWYKERLVFEMAKYRAIKNQKHSLRKARNRIRRKGDSWYNKEWLFKLRINGKKEVKEQINEQ